jgi:biotin carboxylase
MDPLLIISGGTQLYREYALRALAADYSIVLLDHRPNTWQAPYLHDFAQVPLIDKEAVITVAAALKERYSFRGVVTYDEAFVEETAMVAEYLGLPTNSFETVHHCRDKHLMRQVWRDARVPSARSYLVTSLDEAEEAAQEIGYPVVMKPRGLAASVGVIRVNSADNLPAGYAIANIKPLAIYRAAGDGILVEEYLDGAEVSVECAVVRGQLNIIAITRKQVGLAPAFEELGHIVAPNEPLPEEAAIRTVVEAAHKALGIHMGVTHAELRLTKQGPRMIELGVRSAGDLIPRLVQLATGIDLNVVSAQIACNEGVTIEPAKLATAAIRFFYPPYDARVLKLAEKTDHGEYSWLHDVVFEAHVGRELCLPPRGFLSRMGFVIVTGTSINECQTRTEQAQSLLDIELERLPDQQPSFAEVTRRR